MSEFSGILPTPKKSVALSGTVAGNTAICTVGRTGDDLYYRGCTIRALADHATFEEVAFLPIHSHLPTQRELSAYNAKLTLFRALPAALRSALELVPLSAHPMDVLRSACSMLGSLFPERAPTDLDAARTIADRLVASLGSILCYWYHFTQHGRRIETETNDSTVASHFLHLLHGRPPTAAHAKALDVSLTLYAEHEFNTSTFAGRVIAGTGSDMYSAITGRSARYAVPSMAAPTKWRSKSSGATPAPMKPRRTFSGASHRAISSLASDTRYIPKVNRAVLSSRRSPSNWRSKKMRRLDSRSRIASKA